MKHKLLTLCMLIVCCGMAQPTLVKDINTGSYPGDMWDSWNSNSGVLGSTLYLNVDNGIDGAELWKTDGTAGGTSMIKNINTFANGPRSAGAFTLLGSSHYFISNGNELWKTNGTPAGTTLVKQFPLGVAGVFVLGSYMIIPTYSGLGGNVQFWKSDGTTAGTTMYATLTSTASEQNFRFKKFGSMILFSFSTGTSWDQLYKTDGTTATLVKNINPGMSALSWYAYNNAAYPNESNFVEFQGKIWFFADDGTSIKIWKTDGTTAGTVAAIDVTTVGATTDESSNLGATSTRLYFYATVPGSGNELCESDGTAAGTGFYDMEPGFSGFNTPYDIYDHPIRNSSATHVFFKDDNTGNLWSVNNTVGAKNLNVSGDYWGWYSYWSGSYLYQALSSGMCKTDGTVAGTTTFAPALITGGGADNFATLGSTVYFMYNDQLHKTDGTTAGTVPVTAVNTTINAGGFSSQITQMTKLNSTTAVFSATDGTNGLELWKTDATTGGTVMVKDINTGSSGSSPTNFMLWGGNVYFTAYSSTGGTELWKTDGTAAGTVVVKDIFAGTGSGNPTGMTIFGSNLYFSATDGASNYELWKTDGTTAGTVMVKNINAAGSSMGSPVFYSGIMGVMGAKLYFSADDGVNGLELWSTDGTTGGTTLVKDVNAGATGSQATGGIIWGGNLYFVANNGSTGRELWKSDGTTGGTVLLKDVYTGANNSDPNSFFQFGTKFYFMANNGTNGIELWNSDGTAAGTTLLKDVVAGSTSGNITDIITNGSYFFFFAKNGLELWKSTGTTAGTTLISAVNQNTAVRPVLHTGNLYFVSDNEVMTSNGTTATMVSALDQTGTSFYSFPTAFCSTNLGLLVSLDNQNDGNEIWSYNGTSASLLGNIDANAQSGYASNFFGLGSTLLFVATNNTNGYELFKLSGYTMTTGIEDAFAEEQSEVSTESPFVIYPVPSKESITIASKDGNDKVSMYEIVDIQGRLITKRAIQPEATHSIDINEYKSGIYFISIITDNGFVYTSKFIKQ